LHYDRSAEFTVDTQMDLPDLVLVRGGAHAADCWDLAIAELACQEPKLRVLAVDLPGRGRNPADLAAVTIADWVNSGVEDIEDASLGDVVVVGHSLGGSTVPGVVARLGAARVREMVPPGRSGGSRTSRSTRRRWRCAWNGQVGPVGRQRAGLALRRAAITRAARRGGQGRGPRLGGDRAGLRDEPADDPVAAIWAGPANASASSGHLVTS
jgi:pimeloyl-ACP methyl ester carboxylesterase